MARVRLDKRTREAIRAKRAVNRSVVSVNLSTPWVRPVREIVNVTRSGVIQYGRVDSTLRCKGRIESKTLIIKPLPEGSFIGTIEEVMDDVVRWSKAPEIAVGRKDKRIRMDKARDPVRLKAVRERTQKDKDQSHALRQIGEFGQCDRRSDYELRQASSLGVTVVEE